MAASRHQARNSLNCTPSPFSRASSATRRNQEFCTAMSPSDGQPLSACTSPVRMSPSHHPTPSFAMSARRLGTIVRFSPPIAHLTDVALGKRRFDHGEIASGLPQSTDIVRVRRLVSKVPEGVLHRLVVPGRACTADVGYFQLRPRRVCGADSAPQRGLSLTRPMDSA